MELQPIECEYSKCALVFTPKRRWQKYCTTYHRYLAFNERHPLVERLPERYSDEYKEALMQASGSGESLSDSHEQLAQPEQTDETRNLHDAP